MAKTKKNQTKPHLEKQAIRQWESYSPNEEERFWRNYEKLLSKVRNRHLPLEITTADEFPKKNLTASNQRYIGVDPTKIRLLKRAFIHGFLFHHHRKQIAWKNLFAGVFFAIYLALVIGSQSLFLLKISLIFLAAVWVLQLFVKLIARYKRFQRSLNSRFELLNNEMIVYFKDYCYRIDLQNELGYIQHTPWGAKLFSVNPNFKTSRSGELLTVLKYLDNAHYIEVMKQIEQIIKERKYA